MIQYNEMSAFYQDTPNPGHYHIRDFIEEAELNPVKKTYGFKGVGRRKPTLGLQRADVLVPATHDYCIQDPSSSQPSYFFRNCPRPDMVYLGVRDKVGSRQRGIVSLKQSTFILWFKKSFLWRVSSNYWLPFVDGSRILGDKDCWSILKILFESLNCILKYQKFPLSYFRFTLRDVITYLKKYLLNGCQDKLWGHFLMGQPLNNALSLYWFSGKTDTSQQKGCARLTLSSILSGVEVLFSHFASEGSALVLSIVQGHTLWMNCTFSVSLMFCL